MKFKIGDEIQTISSKENKDAIFKVFKILAIEDFDTNNCYVCKSIVKQGENVLQLDLGVIPVSAEEQFCIYSIEGEK